MSTDDFEKRLRRQNMRPMPREWREEILDAARRACVHERANPDLRTTQWWRELLWPCPQAWACLAAVWVVVLLLNLDSREPVRVAKTTIPAPEFFMALREHRRLLAELMGTPLPVETQKSFEPRKPSEPRPRGEIAHPMFTDQFA
jgi:hypothetical protein